MRARDFWARVSPIYDRRPKEEIPMSHILEEASVAAAEFRLSNGCLARVRDADPAADRRIDLLLLQARFMRGGAINPLVGARARAVLSIVEIDGEPLPWPPCRPRHADLTAYLNRFTGADVEALALSYNAANPDKMTQLLRTGPRRGRVMA